MDLTYDNMLQVQAERDALQDKHERLLKLQVDTLIKEAEARAHVNALVKAGERHVAEVSAFMGLDLSAEDWAESMDNALVPVMDAITAAKKARGGGGSVMKSIKFGRGDFLVMAAVNPVAIHILDVSDEGHDVGETFPDMVGRPVTQDLKDKVVCVLEFENHKGALVLLNALVGVLMELAGIPPEPPLVSVSKEGGLNAKS